MKTAEKVGFKTIGLTAVAIAVGFYFNWQAGLGVFGVLVYMLPNDIRE